MIPLRKLICTLKSGSRYPISIKKVLTKGLEMCFLRSIAEAMGSSYKGKACGSFGKFGVYSYNGNKIITTSGGGMLLSDDKEALEKAQFWATQARDPAPWYQHSEMGFNYRMSNIVAGIGRGQIRVLDERVKARRAVFERYREHYGRLQEWTLCLKRCMVIVIGG